MLKSVFDRQLGVLRPSVLIQAERSRRALSLELSKFREFASPSTASLFCLDLDSNEYRYLLCGGSRKWMGIYDIASSSGNPKVSFSLVGEIDGSRRSHHSKSILTCKWYPTDNGLFISSGMDGKLKIWDSNRLKVADEHSFSSPVFHHDASRLPSTRALIAVGTEKDVKLVDIKSGSSVHSLRNGHTDSVVTLQWSNRDENVLATGGSDGSVFLWDIRRSRSCLARLDKRNKNQGKHSSGTAHNDVVTSVQFVSCGTRLLTYGRDDKLRLWDIQSGRNLKVNYGTTANECQKALNMAVSMGTKPELAFVPSESDIAVYEVNSGNSVQRLRGHYNQVTSCVYQPHLQEVYSTGNDKSILVWSADRYSDYVEDKGDHSRSKPSASHTVTVDTWSDDDG